jgi:hypothetical protein
VQTKLPNPFLFLFSTLAPAKVVETAAAPDLTDPPVAAAENFVRGFDPHRFLNQIECGIEPEVMPQFLSSPSREFLLGCGLGELVDILENAR